MIKELLINTVAVVLYLGVPVIPLILLAVRVGHWHEENPDPPDIT